MAYRMVYLRIHANGYGLDWLSENDEAMFQEESRRIFQELGWTLHAQNSDGCDIMIKGQQDLCLYPIFFTGVMDEAEILPLQEALQKAQTFQCYALDCHEEYLDMSDEEYWSALEAKRGEIIAFALEQCKTQRTDLYITMPVALCLAEEFEICRLCDKDRLNNVGNQFMIELIGQLLKEGMMVTAETAWGEGIRTATAKEQRSARQPVQQIEGQICMM